jgi:hypothetical protein
MPKFDVQEFVTESETLIRKIKPISVARYIPAKGNFKKSTRILHSIWSDWHIGSDIDVRETNDVEFGKVQESRRVAFLVKNILEYKTDHRDETTLVLHVIGDMIEGYLHDPQTGAKLSEQFFRCTSILVQALGVLSQGFKKVVVLFAVGNHGRNKAIHTQRAAHEKWNAIESMLYYAVRQALRNVTNIEFVQPYTPFVTYSALGFNYFSTHGDTVLFPGSPERSIDVKGLANQINALNASVRKDKRYHVISVGHTHSAAVVPLTSGTYAVYNGALVPTGPYAQSIGLLKTLSYQTIFESTEKFALGDVRQVRIGKDADNDSSLDAIIKPWKSL